MKSQFGSRVARGLVLSVQLAFISVIGLAAVGGGALSCLGPARVARWVEDTVQLLTSGSVRLAGLDGSFPRHLKVSRLEIRTGDGFVAVRNLDFLWDPYRLFQKQLVVNRISVGDLTVRHGGSREAASGGEGPNVPAWVPPIVLEHLHLARFKLEDVHGGGQPAVEITAVGEVQLARAALHARLKVGTLEGPIGRFTADLTKREGVPSGRFTLVGLFSRVPGTLALARVEVTGQGQPTGFTGKIAVEGPGAPQLQLHCEGAALPSPRLIVTGSARVAQWPHPLQVGLHANVPKPDYLDMKWSVDTGPFEWRAGIGFDIKTKKVTEQGQLQVECAGLSSLLGVPAAGRLAARGHRCARSALRRGARHWPPGVGSGGDRFRATVAGHQAGGQGEI